MTTADFAGSADAVGGGQMDEAGLFGAGDDPRADAGLLDDRLQEFAAVLGLARRAGGGRDDLVDLCDSASRRNFDSTCSAACMASGVSARPSRPPAPSRTISFSRSMTSKDRSGRTCTTIMWSELVPMSMAARRIERSFLL